MSPDTLEKLAIISTIGQVVDNTLIKGLQILVEGDNQRVDRIMEACEGAPDGENSNLQVLIKAELQAHEVTCQMLLTMHNNTLGALEKLTEKVAPLIAAGIAQAQASQPEIDPSFCETACEAHNMANENKAEIEVHDSRLNDLQRQLANVSRRLDKALEDPR